MHDANMRFKQFSFFQFFKKLQISINIIMVNKFLFT
jgi:hypothetical protein